VLFTPGLTVTPTGKRARLVAAYSFHETGSKTSNQFLARDNDDKTTAAKDSPSRNPS
jgi:hypothetical protein